MKYKNIMRMNPDLMVFFQVKIRLEKVKDGACVKNLDEYADTGTH